MKYFLKVYYYFIPLICEFQNIIGNLKPGGEMRIIFHKTFQPIVLVIGFVSKYGWQPTTQQTTSTLHYQLNSDVIKLIEFKVWKNEELTFQYTVLQMQIMYQNDTFLRKIDCNCHHQHFPFKILSIRRAFFKHNYALK